MNLVIDVGNTRAKCAFFDEDRLLAVHYSLEAVFEEIGKWKEKGQHLDIFLSGSGRMEDGSRLLLKELADVWMEASPRMALPVKIGYSTPETLGFDRIAGCVGAMSLQPRKALLVIDSGTCITFNYVNEEGLFIGGNISPGLEMRFHALHDHTARLPYVSPAAEYGGIGTSTETAIRNGVMDGMVFEIEGYIQRFLRGNSTGKVVITGGNARFLKGKISREEVEFCDCLSFIGLNEIFRFAKKINNSLK